ncbi:MAG: hypothetical protein D6805_02360 [Planctomycetota bacterium]|nr:MAG: hypothetical protein D6805_02360 [Planctomycetota bacterium]
MISYSIFTLCFLGLPLWSTSPPLGGENSSKHFLPSKDAAVVVVMCEPYNRSAGKMLEKYGKRLLEPWVRPYYRTKYWLLGPDATPEAFLQTIRKAAKSHKVVDVLIFAHGKKGYLILAGKKTLSNAQIVQGLQHRGGEKIRMVYTTACYSQTHLKAWKQAGAFAVRGAPGVNRPLDFPRFYLGWMLGEDFRKASQNGYKWNKILHQFYNQLHPFLRQTLRLSSRWLQKYQPRQPREKKLYRRLKGALRIMKHWFRTSWNPEESKPYFLGGNPRIYQNPHTPSKP